MAFFMPRVIWFEIPIEKSERAIEFYKKVFGWKIERWQGGMEYYLVTTGEQKEPGIDGALMIKTQGMDKTVNTISVPSVDEYPKKIVASGGKVIVPKRAIQGMGWFAYAMDTEGNAFGIMQNDPNAK